MPVNHIIRRAILISSILATSCINPALALSKRLAIQCNMLTVKTTLVWLAITDLIRRIKMVLPICPLNFIPAAQPDHVMSTSNKGYLTWHHTSMMAINSEDSLACVSSYCCRQRCRVRGTFSNSVGWIVELSFIKSRFKNGKGLSIHDAIAQSPSNFF
jgi:hypothetical protein